MTVTAIDHINLSVPSAKLPDMVRFYTGIVGLEEGARPKFPFPGHWLYVQGRTAAVLHLASYAEDELALAQPTGRFNHVCFRLRGMAEAKARLAAATLQEIRPDVLLLNELDWDADGETVRRFMTNFLAVGQEGRAALDYPYIYVPEVNTGVHSGHDLDRDGVVTNTR